MGSNAKSKMYVITSWDDTDQLDLRLVKLLDKYDMRGTFFVISDWIGKKIELDNIRDISINHEIGAHTASHVTLTNVSDNVAYEEILESKNVLESELDKEINSFAYPKGKYNEKHMQMVEQIGFSSGRTTKPFYINKPKDRYEMHNTLWTYPHAFKDIIALSRLYKISNEFIFNPSLIKKWNILGEKIFDTMLDKGGVFHIFGHAWQIEEKKAWSNLEILFEHISMRSNVEYLTISDYIEIISKSDGYV